MKIYGLAPHQIKDALKLIHCTINVQSDKGLLGGVQGQVHAKPPHVFSKCFTTQTQALKVLWDVGASKQVLNKCVVKKNWVGTKALSKVKGPCPGCVEDTLLCKGCKQPFFKGQTGGYSHCHKCHLANPQAFHSTPGCMVCQNETPSPTKEYLAPSTSPKPSPPSKLPKPPKSTPISYDPIQGELPTDGQASLPTTLRPIGSSVMGLYVLEELNNELTMFLLKGQYLVSRGVWTDKEEEWRNETVWDDNLDDTHPGTGLQVRQAVEAFWQYKREYESALARNLFDYLAVIALGEARHGRNVLFDGVSKRSVGRSSMFKGALAYDPRHFLPAVAIAFEEGMYGGGYGGGSWGKICRAAAKYFQFKDMPIVFADHVVDLSHNGGVAFNKNIIFSRDMGDSAYINMLDTKKETSLLQSTLTLALPWEVFMWVRRFQAPPYALPFYTAKVKAEEDAPSIPFIKWGEKVLEIALTGAPISESEEIEYTGGRETYPRDARLVTRPARPYPFKVGDVAIARTTGAEFTITKVDATHYYGWWSKAGKEQDWTPDPASITSYPKHSVARLWSLKAICAICGTLDGASHNFQEDGHTLVHPVAHRFTLRKGVSQ